MTSHIPPQFESNAEGGPAGLDAAGDLQGASTSGAVTRPFAKGIYLKYSQLEKVDAVSQVQHPIIREVLALFDTQNPQVEITTLADIPAGTGPGVVWQLHHGAAEGDVCPSARHAPADRARGAGLRHRDQQTG